MESGGEVRLDVESIHELLPEARSEDGTSIRDDILREFMQPKYVVEEEVGDIFGGVGLAHG